MNMIEAMGSFTSTVSVVTTHTKNQDWGMTCSSVSVVSLEPSRVLWSIDKSRRSHDAFLNSSGYMVNVLQSDQKDLAMHFAQGTQEERFANQTLVRGVDQHPRLANVLAWFDCKLVQVVSSGDHDILIGEVIDCGSNQGSGLAYGHANFGVLTPLNS